MKKHDSSNYFHVAYVTDNRYAMPTHISILSLLENKKADVRYFIHVIGEHLSEKHKEYLSKLDSSSCVIDYLEADESFYSKMIGKSTRKNTYISDCAMQKFALPQLLGDVDKVLYLDGDTIINNDVSELFSLDISAYYVAAVDCVASCPIGLDFKQYFNSGVMLLNLKRMRKEHITEKLIAYKMNCLNFYMDQDAFNAVFLGHVLFISAIYNMFVHEFMVLNFDMYNDRYFKADYKNEQERIAEGKIYHANGRFKPWLYSLPFFSEVFEAYYRKSAYRREVLKLKSPIPVLLEEQQREYEAVIKEKNEHIRDLNLKLSFPREEVDGKKVILYGAGRMGYVYRKCLENVDCEIVLWVDKNWEGFVGPEVISSPSLIMESRFDVILIAIASSSAVEEVSKTLTDMGVDPAKIVCSRR